MQPNLQSTLDTEAYLKWANLLESFGICTDTVRRSFLETRLRICMKTQGFNNFYDYYNYLKSLSRNNPEWRVLTDSLTVQETRFFRHLDSLSLISKFLLLNQSSCSESRRSFHAWSVACATGEEAYSLAIVFDQNLRTTNNNAFFGITATDISHSALTTGKQGIYHRSKLTNIPLHLQNEYFIPLDDHYSQVKLNLRNRVCFSRMNVLKAIEAPLGKMDIIVCQNFLIYFTPPKRPLILDTLITHLAPGGLLILSISDAFNWSHPALERINHENTLAYRRKPNP